jgi:DHA2 family multidrug resistance protein
MSASTTRSDGQALPNDVGANPWLIAVLVSLAAFMEVLDTTIANVALRYIAGPPFPNGTPELMERSTAP